MMRFTKNHAWAIVENDNSILIGITDHAQHALGDIIFVELPEAGEMIAAGKECAVIESVRFASDIYSPVSGEVLTINEDILTAPDLVNQDPHAEGWFIRVRPSNILELEELMNLADYEAYLAQIAN